MPTIYACSNMNNKNQETELSQQSQSVPNPITSPESHDLGPQTTPPSPSLTSERKSKRKFVIVGALVIILILICGSVGALYYSNHHRKTTVNKNTSQVSTQNAASNKNSAQTTSSICSTSSKLDLKSQETTGGVNIKYISVSPSLVNGGQYNEYADFSTGCGHYAYINQASGSGFSAISSLGGQLIYDGKITYSGANLSSAVLSQNGLHMAYELITAPGTFPYTGTAAIYVDGKLVKSGDNITLVAVSNDGTSCAYTQQTSKLTATPSNSGIPGENLYTSSSSNPLYSWPLGFLGVSMGGNLSNYLAQLRPSSQDYQLAYNSQSVYIGQEPQQVVASPSANHYGYTIASTASGSSSTGGEIDIDGKTVAQNAQFAGLTVTDNGDYAYYNEDNQQVVIDSKSYPVAGLPSGSGGAKVYINKNASDRLIGITPDNTTTWQLNGSTLNISGTVDNADFDNTTLYIYVQS
jgi:hypothetical protein